MTAFLLRWSLRAGAQIPGLFIYDTIPSHVYQDRGIGTFAIGWVAFLAAAAGRKGA